MKNLKYIGIITIILGAIATLYVMTSTASFKGGASDLLITFGFYVWVMVPFLVLLALTSVIYRKNFTAAAGLAILFTSISVVASSVMLYWDAIFNSASSTSSLIFVVLPLYALAATAILYPLAWLVSKAFLPKAKG